jgi:hypothetical protein
MNKGLRIRIRASHSVAPQLAQGLPLPPPLLLLTNQQSPVSTPQSPSCVIDRFRPPSKLWENRGEWRCWPAGLDRTTGGSAGAIYRQARDKPSPRIDTRGEQLYTPYPSHVVVDAPRYERESPGAPAAAGESPIRRRGGASPCRPDKIPRPGRARARARPARGCSYQSPHHRFRRSLWCECVS